MKITAIILAAMISSFNCQSNNPLHSDCRKIEQLGGCPGKKPALLAPGFISTGADEWGLAISPDFDEIYYTLMEDGPSRIVFTTWDGEKWSEPVTAPFSGEYVEAEPFFDQEGGKLFYTSRRPVDSSDTTREKNIWFVERKGDGWSKPELAITTGEIKDKLFPSIAENGNIYFTAALKDSKGKYDIYKSEYDDGKYGKPVNLGEVINTEYGDYCPVIAPDESYIIYETVDKPGGLGGGDLYFSSRSPDGSWSAPEHLDTPFNSARNDFYLKLSPCGKFLILHSNRFAEGIEEETDENIPGNGSYDIYWMQSSTLEHYIGTNCK